MRNDKSKRRSAKAKKNLKVDTEDLPTPKTAASTPGTTPSVRSSSDLRSPGQRKSPVMAQQGEQPIPDFITQTDRYGNASTPRTNDALSKARQEHPPQSPTEQTGDDDSSHVEACAETFLDSLRLVCCCLAPDESEAPAKQAPKQIVAEQKENVPRLLPELHPDDTGKKCLVLDLDETLVHSSFRAVPGADFIIPVQVRRAILRYAHNKGFG